MTLELVLGDDLPDCGAIVLATDQGLVGPAGRRLRDDELAKEIGRVFEGNYGAYGAPKVWRQLSWEGVEVARRMALMLRQGLAGQVRGGKMRRTTVAVRPADLVERNFNAFAPNQLWVADLTYVAILVPFRLHRLRDRRLLPAHGRLADPATACEPTWTSTPWRWPSGPAKTTT